MLVQTNSYIVTREKRPQHARLMRRFRQTLAKLGCDQFDVYEQLAPNFAPLKTAGRFVQIMRFRDRKHYQSVQEAERNDPAAQQLIREFCDLIDLEYQKDRSLFATGFYSSALTSSSEDAAREGEAPAEPPAADAPPDQPACSVESRDFTTADADPAAQQQAIADLQNRPPQQPPLAPRDA